MSLKDNYLELARKHGGPYALMKKGVKKGIVNSILRGSIPAADELLRVARVLDSSIEELLEGKKSAIQKGDTAPNLSLAEAVVDYKTEKPTKEEQAYCDKLVDVLRNPETKKAIQENIDTFLKVPGGPEKKITEEKKLNHNH